MSFERWNIRGCLNRLRISNDNIAIGCYQDLRCVVHSVSLNISEFKEVHFLSLWVSVDMSVLNLQCCTRFKLLFHVHLNQIVGLPRDLKYGARVEHHAYNGIFDALWRILVTERWAGLY